MPGKIKVELIEGSPYIKIKIGKKRRGWIKVWFRSSGGGCSSCVFYPRCNYSGPVCAKIESELIAQGLYLPAPSHYYLCRA